MSRIKGSTEKDIDERRNAIKEILEDFENQKKRYTKKMLLEELSKKGFEIDLRTLYRDRVALSRTDTFVRDIAESTYSALVHNVFDELDDMEEQLREWTENPPKVYKQIKQYDPSDPNTPSRIRIIEETISPIQVVQLRLRLSEIRLSVYNGDIIDTSLALLINTFNDLNDEIDKKNIEIAKLSNKNQ